MVENDLSYQIRGCIFKVYNGLGPGLFESVYETVMEYELNREGLLIRKQVPLPLFYDGVRMDIGFKIDLLVNDLVLVEIKSVENLAAVHHKQVLTYLKLADLRLGLLVNFNTEDISKSIFRKIN